MNFVFASPLESVNDVDDLGLGKDARPRIPLQSAPEKEFATETGRIRGSLAYGRDQSS